MNIKMTIEFTNIGDAIKYLGLVNSLENVAVDIETEPIKSESKKKETAKQETEIIKTIAAPKQETEATEVIDAPKQEVSKEEPKYTAADIRMALMDLSRTKGREKVADILSKVGVSNVTAIKETDFPEVMKMIREV